MNTLLKTIQLFCAIMIISSYCYGQRKFSEMDYRQQKISDNVLLTFIVTTNATIFYNSKLNNNFNEKMQRNSLILVGSLFIYSAIGTINRERNMQKLQLSKTNIGITYTF